MKRGGPLKRRTRLKAHSERGQSYADELAELAPLVEFRSRGNCECGRGCGLRGAAAHHRKRRSQGGPNTLANLLWLADACHAHVHANPSESYDAGLLIRRDDPITPYQGAMK